MLSHRRIDEDIHYLESDENCYSGALPWLHDTCSKDGTLLVIWQEYLRQGSIQKNASNLKDT